MPDRALSRPACAAILVFMVSNCNQPASPENAAQKPDAARARSLDLNGRTELLAASERFENLTEAAFAADPGETEERMVLARKGAEAARPFLSDGTARDFGSLNVALSRAAAAHSQVDLAIASNELYRFFMTAAQGDGKIPLEIGLLDYAGFRYWADGRDQPPRWDDMAAAHSLAEYEWRAVRARISNPQVAARFDDVLTALGVAVTARDSRGAAAAVQRELDQVDVLEMTVSPA